MLTVGTLEYPLPDVRTTTNATRSPSSNAFAVAPLPPPPLIVTTGSLVYPLPPDVTWIPVTYPEVTVARAVAVSPATHRIRTSQTNPVQIQIHRRFIQELDTRAFHRSTLNRQIRLEEGVAAETNQDLSLSPKPMKWPSSLQNDLSLVLPCPFVLPIILSLAAASI